MQDVARTSLTGHATVILSGISVGFESAVYTALIIAGAVYSAFLLGGGSIVNITLINNNGLPGMAHSAAAHQAERLVAEEPNRIPAYTIEIDIIEKQKRIYYFAKRMAKSVSALNPDQV